MNKHERLTGIKKSGVIYFLFIEIVRERIASQ